jgi:hypothetical protein
MGSHAEMPFCTPSNHSLNGRKAEHNRKLALQKNISLGLLVKLGSIAQNGAKNHKKLPEKCSFFLKVASFKESCPGLPIIIIIIVQYFVFVVFTNWDQEF